MNDHTNNVIQPPYILFNLSLFAISSKGANSIGKVFKDFLWEDTSREGGPHLVNWEQCNCLVDMVASV